MKNRDLQLKVREGVQVPEGEPKSTEFGKGSYILLLFFFEMVGPFYPAECSAEALYVPINGH